MKTENLNSLLSEESLAKVQIIYEINDLKTKVYGGAITPEEFDILYDKGTEELKAIRSWLTMRQQTRCNPGEILFAFLQTQAKMRDDRRNRE